MGRKEKKEERKKGEGIFIFCPFPLPVHKLSKMKIKTQAFKKCFSEVFSLHLSNFKNKIWWSVRILLDNKISKLLTTKKERKADKDEMI